MRYVLIRWGGKVPGQRPRSQVAMITTPIGAPTMRVRIVRWHNPTQCWHIPYNSERAVMPADVLHTFVRTPHGSEIRGLKRTLARED